MAIKRMEQNFDSDEMPWTEPQYGRKKACAIQLKLDGAGFFLIRGMFDARPRKIAAPVGILIPKAF